MSGNQNRSRFSLHSPATFNIMVVGHVDKSWSEELGLSVNHRTINEGMAITVLRGKIMDQAALFGILNGLYGLGFPLYSVECESWA